MFWGFSEAFDLQEEYAKNVLQDPTELNILLYGTGDPRHILKTVSKAYKHTTKLNFYCIDGCIEQVARNMLLLLIAFEKPDYLSLKNKTHLFMDIYGNSLLRPLTNNYMASKSQILRKIITDSEYMEEIVPIFNIDNLKYRERDGLEETFNFWLPRAGHIYDIQHCWSARIRHTLGSRYDHRVGAFDWDLQMCLKDRGANQICSQEYLHWRETGVAFTFPEYEQCCPNKTLSAGLIRNGSTYRHRGYVGDAEVGPFCAFGLKTTDESMMKSFHGTNDYRATDLTERNIYEILSEIQDKQDYTHSSKNTHKYGSATLVLGKTISEKKNETVDLKKYDKPILKIENVKIYFLSIEDTLALQKGGKFEKFFDVVYSANNYFAFMEEDFKKIFKESCLVIFETKLFSVAKKTFIAEFLEKIKKFATKCNLEAVTNFNINLNYSVVKYKTILSNE